MKDIKIIDIQLPNPVAVHRGETGQSLVVIFTYKDTKFRCTYIQEHYFYRGMPGECSESCRFEKIKEGEVLSTIKCDGKIKIPHYDRDAKGNRLEVRAYADHNYMGDDPRFLNATESVVLKYLIEPFISMYW